MTGNKKVFSPLAASNHSGTEREENDFYATPEIATKALLKMLKKHGIMQDKTRAVWEPCCGKGHITKVLADDKREVSAQDLIVRPQISSNYEYIAEPRDMFKTGSISENTDIITNPPYGLCNEAVEHCLGLLHNGSHCAMLLKIQFLETKKRYELFKRYPPKWVFIFSSRIECAKGGNFYSDGQGGAACFAWYVWEKGFSGYPQIDWIEPFDKA